MRNGLILLALLLVGCGDSSGSEVANTPTPTPPAVAPSVRTVLTPLGLNFHSRPSVQSDHVGTAQQGTLLTVLGSDSGNGGWYHVQGQTTSGWISADSSLSAPGRFVFFSSSNHQFGALYPENWTFSATSTDVAFRPQKGSVAIVVSGPEAEAQIPPSGAPGYGETGDETAVVCGVTGTLHQYQGIPASSSAVPGVPLKPLLAQIRLQLDSTTAMQLTYTYDSAAQLQDFRNFYNSLSFPWPQCEQPAPSPSPS